MAKNDIRIIRNRFKLMKKVKYILGRPGLGAEQVSSDKFGFNFKDLK